MNVYKDIIDVYEGICLDIVICGSKHKQYWCRVVRKVLIIEGMLGMLLKSIPVEVP